MKSNEQRLKGIADWAKTLPPEAWIPGPPTPLKYGLFWAVKTKTGRILSGSSGAFRPGMQREITWDIRYQGIVSHVQAGD